MNISNIVLIFNLESYVWEKNTHSFVRTCAYHLPHISWILFIAGGKFFRFSKVAKLQLWALEVAKIVTELRLHGQTRSSRKDPNTYRHMKTCVESDFWYWRGSCHLLNCFRYICVENFKTLNKIFFNKSFDLEEWRFWTSLVDEFIHFSIIILVFGEKLNSNFWILNERIGSSLPARQSSNINF